MSRDFELFFVQLAMSLANYIFTSLFKYNGDNSSIETERLKEDKVLRVLKERHYHITMGALMFFLKFVLTLRTM